MGAKTKTRNIGSFGIWQLQLTSVAFKSRKQLTRAALCFFVRVSACHMSLVNGISARIFRAVKSVVLLGSESG
jgi:hypothetical protein